MENEIVETQEKEAVKKTVKPKKIKDEKKNKSHSTNWLACFIAGLIGAASMYLFVYYVMPMGSTSTVINKIEKEVNENKNSNADHLEKFYYEVVVVTVYKNETLSASGTGFVYKVNGKKAYILTNNHVVDLSGKSAVKVIFTNGEEVEVKIEGTDEYSDLAVLSVDADKIVDVAEIGKSEDVRLGDTVFTLGAPLDTEYYWSVTRGVVSGKDRMVEVSLTSSNTSDYVMKVLQTDAAINSGNSGGPIANSNGQVIGITNMKLVSNGVEGIGFAIPIEDAVTFAEAIINGESIKKPLIGVKMLNLSDRWSLYSNGITLNTELTSGVVVVEAQKGAPAAQAGLTRGDIIVAIDGEEVKNVARLRYYLYRHTVGDTVTVTIERNGKKQDVKLKLTVANEE